MCTTTTENPAHLTEAMADLERVSGLRDFRLQLTELGSLVSAGQQRLRRGERERALARQPSTPTFERQFAIAGRQAGLARQSLRTALQSETWNEIRGSVDTGGVEFGEALTDLREMWLDALVEADGPAIAVTEVAEIIDRVSSVTQLHGVGGLGAFVEEQLAEFDRVLVADRDWGREPHSPLEWWEWCLLACLVGASVFGVLACFWWSDCSWVRSVLAAFCAAVANIAGLEWLTPTCRALLQAIR